jgi:DEAD/DEAH box helicase domain-containing protein
LLQNPDAALWERLALARAFRFSLTQDTVGQWLRAAAEHLPEPLAAQLEEEASREGAIVGLVEEESNAAGDPVTIWSVATQQGMNAVRSDVEQARRSVTVALHLNDQADPTEGFEAAWNGLLRLYNLLQFIPNVYPAATDAESGAGYRELIGRFSSEGMEDMVPNEGTGPDDEAWAATLEYALEETRDLLIELRGVGTPPPTMPMEYREGGAIIAEAELGWPDSKVVILLPDQAEHRGAFEKAGWTLMALADAIENPEDVAEVLNATSEA